MGAAANLDAVAGTRASSWQCATTNKKEGAEAICWKLGRGVKEWERFLERFLTLALSSNEEERELGRDRERLLTLTLSSNED